MCLNVVGSSGVFFRVLCVSSLPPSVLMLVILCVFTCSGSSGVLCVSSLPPSVLMFVIVCVFTCSGELWCFSVCSPLRLLGPETADRNQASSPRPRGDCCYCCTYEWANFIWFYCFLQHNHLFSMAQVLLH